MSFIKTVKSYAGRQDLLITARANNFLGANQNWSWTDEDMDLIRSILMENSNAVRHSRFGASSRGTCQRAQIFGFLGMPTAPEFNPHLFNIFSDGHFRHLRWQLMGIKAGFLTHVEVPATMKKNNLSVSLDGVNEDEGFIFELKGAYRVPNVPPHHHLLQIHTYFYVTGYEVCSYVNENKGTNAFHEDVVVKDKKIFEEVHVEIQQLNGALHDQKLPSILPECRAKKGVYKTCPYAKDNKCLKQESVWPVGNRWA